MLRKHKFNLLCGEQSSRTQTHPNNHLDQPVITGHYSSSSSRYITAVLTDACEKKKKNVRKIGAKTNNNRNEET